MKMDTSTWKEFRVDSLFEVIPVKHRLGRVDLDDIGCPVYSSDTRNNGVLGFYSDVPEFKIDDNNPMMIVFGDHTKSMNIVTESFCVMDNVKVLNPIVKNEMALLFLTTVWRSMIPDLGYARHWNVAKNILIKLPATSSGDPDWNYMEQYMRSVMENCEKKYQTLVRISLEKHQVDTTAWGEFRVGDLFDVMTSRSIDKIHLDFDVDAPYDFIGRTSINNGVQGKLGKIEFDPNPRGTFSVTQIGERLCQYRENEWYASQNIFVLLPRVDMVRVALFMTTILTEMLKRIYGDDAYASYPTLKSLPNDIIKLPITSSGEPDWDYMEQYMKRIMQRQSVVVEALRKIA